MIGVLIFGTALISQNAAGIDLKALGFYTVINGSSNYISFKEYGSGETKRPLPVSDFPEVMTLNAGDYLLLYGDLPVGPMNTGVDVFTYKKEGDTYKSSGSESSIDSFFSMEPSDPVKGYKVVKLVQKPNTPSGLYFIHKYVGMNGDAYFPFFVK